MSHRIRHIETLVYYDMPQVFIGEDQIGTLYLCYILKYETDGFRYFCTPASSTDLYMFKFGKTSLRDIFVNSAVKQYYTCLINDFTLPSMLLEQYLGELNDEILPDEGFVLDNFDTTAEQSVTEAKKKHTIMLKAVSDAPESDAHIENTDKIDSSYV